MENRIETFATQTPDLAQAYVFNIDDVKNSYEMYDELFRAFRTNPNNRNVIPDMKLDSVDIMEYLKMRFCHLRNKHDAYLLDEFWTWLSNS